MPYHRLLWDSDRDDLVAVKKYEMAGFDLTSLWKGHEVEPFPPDLRLTVDDGDGPLWPDLFGNPVSWYIVSDKLADILCSGQQKGAVQLLPAPLFKQSDGTRVDGYQVLNPLVAIDCLNEGESQLSRSKSGSIASVERCVLNEASIPHDIGMFRLGEMRRAILVSDAIANSTRGKGIRGLAFKRCHAAGSSP